MNKIGILVRKEMTEILRDKKTLIIMLLMPLILYPALLVGGSFGLSMMLQSQMEDNQTVGYLLEDEAYIKPLVSLYEQEKEELESGLVFKGASRAEEAAIREEVDAWISFSKESQTIQIQLDYTSTDQNSNYVEASIQELTDRYRDQLMAQNLKKEGLTEDFLYPVTYEAVDSVSESESTGMYFGGMIGMLLITMILMGAFYPAVDVTTGEKERGTLETLLTLPVTNFQMIMSKFISVSIVACVTALISLIAFGGSILFMMQAVPKEMSSEVTQFPVDMIISSIPVLLLALLATALFVTAFSMCFCVFAKSSKEANNYITPVMLIVMMMSMIGMIPTIELNYTYALIPIINVTLLIKQILSQHLDVSLALTTVVVNFAYSILTIWVLAKMYDSEDIMFSDGFRSFRLFQKRENIKKGTIPATGDVMISLVVLFLAIVYIGGFFTVRDMFLGTIVTQLMILATPLLLTWYMKTDMKKLFSLQKPVIKQLPGSILLYIGSYLLMIIVSMLLTQIFPESTQNVDATFDDLMNHSFLEVTLVIAAMPAIGEELLFRGLTLGSLRHKYKIGWAILISSLIFGAFHMSLVKLLPTAMLGACFAYIVYKGGSIYITMALHFLNNWISILSIKSPEVLEKLLPFMVEEEVSIIELAIIVIIGIICTVAGYLLMNRRNFNKKIEKINKVLTD